MTKHIVPFIILLTALALCQTDTLDIIVLSNSDILKGKVLRIRTESIEFIESSTSIIYEYEKKVINSIVFSNGKIINFSKENTVSPEQNKLLIEEDTIDTQVEVGGGVLFAFKSDNYDGGVGANLFLELRTPSIVAVKTSFGWYSADTKVKYLSKGNSSFYIMELSLLLRSMSGVIQPYGGLGIGYYFVDNTLDDQVIQLFEQYGYGINEDIENGIGFHIRGGVDVLFELNIGFSLEFKYWIYNPKAIATVYPLQNPNQENRADSEIKLNNLSLIIGLVVIL